MDESGRTKPEERGSWLCYDKPARQELLDKTHSLSFWSFSISFFFLRGEEEEREKDLINKYMQAKNSVRASYLPGLSDPSMSNSDRRLKVYINKKKKKK